MSSDLIERDFTAEFYDGAVSGKELCSAIRELQARLRAQVPEGWRDSLIHDMYAVAPDCKLPIDLADWVRDELLSAAPTPQKGVGHA